MSDKLIKGKQMIIFTIACVLLVSQLVGCAEQNKKPEKSDSVVGINSIEESVDLENRKIMKLQLKKTSIKKN